MGCRRNLFSLLALVAIPLMYGLWRITVRAEQRLEQDAYGYTDASDIAFTPYLLAGVGATCLLFLLAWRNGAALTAKRRHEELIAAQQRSARRIPPGQDDPAIREARELWNQQRPQEAMKVLIRRVRELNEERE